MSQFNKEKCTELGEAICSVLTKAISDDGVINLEEIQEQDLGNEFTMALIDSCQAVISHLSDSEWDRLEFNHAVNRIIHQIDK